MGNTLYYGDNLDVLERYIADESVDLVYLDPPFKSNQDYNVLFAEQNGSRAAAQIKAFEDTWRWDQAAARAFETIVEKGGRVSAAMQAFRTFLGESDMMAYLAMMAPRLVELRRVMKPTASIYLHCDTTASHYLKLLMDAVFGPENFINDISWKRSQTRSSISRSFRRAHDVSLFYARGPEYRFDVQYKQLSGASLKLYENEDETGQYQAVPLLVSGKRNGETGKVWRGIDPNTKGKAGMHWVTTPAKLEEYDKNGLILWPDKKDGSPRLKYYLSQSPGVPLSDFWEDIDLISSSAAEALGYPTQKPEALLERIINAGSDPGDLVLDPFCGCGTTIAAAERLGRQWIGIDITHLAITLIKARLKDGFGESATFQVIGEPVSLQDAEQLAKSDQYQFQWWALGLVGARPTEQKKGADKGIDGRLYFHDKPGEKTKQIIFSVKAGSVTVSHLRDLRGVIEREKAEIGVLICLKEPTRPMKTEAASGGFYKSPWGTQHPRIQLLTIKKLLGGKGVDYPPSRGEVTLKRLREPDIPAKNAFSWLLAPKNWKVRQRQRRRREGKQQSASPGVANEYSAEGKKGRSMTHQNVCQHWGLLLGPLFPLGASFEFHAGSQDFRVSIRWRLQTDPGRPHKRSKIIRLVITEEAIEDYSDKSPAEREADDARLVAFVKDKLRSHKPDHDKPATIRPPEVEWIVTSEILDNGR